MDILDKERLPRQRKPRKGLFSTMIDEKDDQWGGGRTTDQSKILDESGRHGVEKPAPKPTKNSLPDPRNLIQLFAVPRELLLRAQGVEWVKDFEMAKETETRKKTSNKRKPLPKDAPEEDQGPTVEGSEQKY
ncbi:hypothetical protein VNI00_013851 [Paramarasmius palmivorus]|uniref:Uncharacterized protein n=1 Tax=Paramarasmius palmivorus TaxID=297713 RepID=A0AAW0BVQ1_9AGAR